MKIYLFIKLDNVRIGKLPDFLNGKINEFLKNVKFLKIIKISTKLLIFGIIRRFDFVHYPKI